MNLSRRSILTGLLSSAAVIAAGPVVKVAVPIHDGFGVGPAMHGLAAWRQEQEVFLEGLAQRAVTTFIYGNPEVPPLLFTGLAPLFDRHLA